MPTDENMAAEKARSFSRVGSLMRSKSEGTLIDVSDDGSSSDHMNGKISISKPPKKYVVNVHRLPDSTVIH